jgi:iron complex outermembrane receptor protein
MKEIIFVFALMVGFQGFSQTGKLVGTVKDKSGEPLIGATVIYKKDVTIGSITDELGAYSLSLPVGEVRIVCRYSGMIADTFFVTIIENNTLSRDIIMKPFIDPDVQDFDDVIVKVGKFDKAFEDQTVSMEVLKPSIIEDKNTRSIETALDQAPGLNILDGEPQIRGGSGFTFGVGSKVAVIVDDMPMLSGDAGRPEWGFIPVENIHQIEIIKGAASVLSGSSALSGSIHIRTAFPELKPKTKVNVYSGMYSKPNMEGATWWEQFPLITGANFLHSRRIGNLDMVLGGNVNHDHGYIGPPINSPTVTYPDTTGYTEKDMASQRGRFNFNIRHRSKKYRGLNYGVNGNVMISRSNMAFAWLDDTSGIYRAYPGAIFLQDQFIFNVDPFVNFFTQANGKHSFRTRLLHSDNQMTPNQNNKTTTYYGDYMFKKSYKNLNGLDFIGGITGQFVDSYSNIYVGSGSTDNRLLNISAYSEIEHKVKNTLNLSVGGRLEYFQLNDTITALKPIFRAGSSIKLYQETYLRASYGQGYRFPTITERYIKTGVGNFGVFPNPELLPESSWNGEIGIKQGLKFGKIFGYLDIAGFWQEYENTIEYMFGIWDGASQTSFAGFKFLNTGKSRVLGIDASFSGMVKFTKNVEMIFMTGYNYIVPKTLNPDYVYAVDDFDRVFSYNSTSLDSASQILKYRFLHNVKADFELKIKKKLSIGVSAKYFSKIINMDGIIKDFEETTANTGGTIQEIRYMDFFNSHRFGNWIFDARMSYKINDHHKVAIISSNILNRLYSLRPLKIEPPRSIMLQYSFTLDKNK